MVSLMPTFTWKDHISLVDANIKFTRDGRVFLDYVVITNQYRLFDFHQPLQHKLEVFRTLKQKVENIST